LEASSRVAISDTGVNRPKAAYAYPGYITTDNCNYR
jgi:hypothetical protein